MSVRSIVCMFLPVAALLLVSGCEPPSTTPGPGVVAGSRPGPPMPPAPPPAPPQAAASEQPASTASSEAARAETAASPAAAEPSPVASPPTAQSTPPTTQPPAAGKQLVQLSAGVAVPQLLPEGTQVGVSVDYKVTGELKTSSRYMLVVEYGGGEIAVPVKLMPPAGNFQGFCPPSIRPEDKPFRVRIDEFAPGSSRGVKVSNTASLQTSY